jgi:hypothetical protein
VLAAQFSSQFSASARQVRSSAVAARSSLVSFEDSASAPWFSSLPVFVFAAEGPLRSGLASHSSCLYHQPGACLSVVLLMCFCHLANLVLVLVCFVLNACM